jgi:hypothetical protein
MAGYRALAWVGTSGIMSDRLFAIFWVGKASGTPLLRRNQIGFIFDSRQLFLKCLAPQHWHERSK